MERRGKLWSCVCLHEMMINDVLLAYLYILSRRLQLRKAVNGASCYRGHSVCRHSAWVAKHAVPLQRSREMDTNDHKHTGRCGCTPYALRNVLRSVAGGA